MSTISSMRSKRTSRFRDQCLEDHNSDHERDETQTPITTNSFRDESKEDDEFLRFTMQMQRFEKGEPLTDFFKP